MNQLSNRKNCGKNGKNGREKHELRSFSAFERMEGPVKKRMKLQKRCRRIHGFSCLSWKSYAILHNELQPVCTATEPAVFYVKETVQHVLFDDAL